jgi:hypothetical protein
MQFFIYLGLGFMLISGICVGAFTTAPQQRRNFYSEQRGDRKTKRKVANWSALGSIISFVIVGAIYLLG